jgi:trigger factor
MQIVRKDADTLNISLELTLEPEDFQPKFLSELKKYKNQGQIKGFRKGMAPDSLIRKMYGKAILLEILDETLKSKLFDYIDEQKLNYLGQPLPLREEEDALNLDINTPKNYTFKFELGIAPEIEVKGVSENDEYPFYDVEIPEHLVEEELTAARRRFGERVKPTENIQTMDMVTLDAKEMENGQVKEGGWETTFNILVDVIKDESVKSNILGKNVGDTITFDIYKLEDKGDQHTNRYLLKKEASDDTVVGNMFSGTIKEIDRVEPAELNEAFFQTFGDPSITDENSCKEFLRNDLKRYYDDQSLQFMYRDIMEFMMEHNDVPLPETFLKKYLKETNEEVSEEVLENEFAAFCKNMKWSLQKSHLAKAYDIEVNEDDIRRHFTSSVFSYMRNYGNMDYSFIQSTVDRLMKDQKQVNKAYEEILADKIFSRIGETVKRKKIGISQEEFVQKVKELNERVNNL